MSLSDEERDAIVFYRIQKAKETLIEAEGIAQLGFGMLLLIVYIMLVII